MGRSGAAPEDIGGIVAADLRNSGKFNPLDRARLPQQPGSAQEVQPAAWSALGIDAVVVGQVTPNPDGSYNVAYQLVDTGGAPEYSACSELIQSKQTMAALRWPYRQ